MKKILYIHQYFITPNQAGGTRSYWFAKELIAKGYEVTMLTSRSQQKRRIEKEHIEGIEVIYIRNQNKQGMSILGRVFSFINFMIFSSWVALQQKNVNLVYATSTPLTIGVPALLCKWFKKYDYYFEVRDLWPEVPIQMGALKNSFIRNLALWLEKTIYKNASHIVALSPGMRNGVLRIGIDENKVSMIPNMSKIDEFYNREKNIEIAAKFNIDLKKLNVIHFGTMGIANGLDYFIYAANEMNKYECTDVCFILCGGGGVKNQLVELSNSLELKNVLFIDKQPMKVVSEIVNLCDISFVPFKNIPILWTNSPNKFFDSLSAGIPIIVNSPGWTKDIVEQNGCGAYVNPEVPKDLAQQIIEWKSKPELLLEMGNKSRLIAEKQYDKSILCRQFVGTIDRYFIRS